MTQSADDREAILARLAEVLETVPGVEHFARNDLALPEDTLPAILLLDGDETVAEDAYGRGSRLPGSVKIVTLLPEVYILVADDPLLVGPSISQLRRRVVKAVLTDDELLGLAVDKDVRYEGMQTGMAMGRSLAGEAALNFSIKYQFDAIALPAVNSNQYLSGTVDGGGDVSGALAMTLSGDIDGGGDVSGALAVTLSGSIDGGGDLGGEGLEHQALLSGTIDGGGELMGDMHQVVPLSGTIDGGGELTGDISVPSLSGIIDGGGELSGVLAQAMSGTVDGGGELEGEIEEPPPPAGATFIGASNIQYSTSGFNLTTHADTEAGDILVLVQASGGNDPSLISGWTNVGSPPVTIGTESTGTGVKTSRKAATGPSETIAIPDSGGHNAAVCLTFRGYDPSLVSFRSSGTGAGAGTSIVPVGSESWNLTDMGMFVYAGRGTMTGQNILASANWNDEQIRASISASLSLFVATSEPAITTSNSFLTGQWTGSVSNRVATVLRLRP